MSDLMSHARDDLNELPRLLYGLNSNRTRLAILRDYAARHDLSAAQVAQLVATLPDGARERPNNLINLALARSVGAVG